MIETIALYCVLTILAGAIIYLVTVIISLSSRIKLLEERIALQNNESYNLDKTLQSTKVKVDNLTECINNQAKMLTEHCHRYEFENDTILLIKEPIFK